MPYKVITRSAPAGVNIRVDIRVDVRAKSVTGGATDAFKLPPNFTWSERDGQLLLYGRASVAP